MRGLGENQSRIREKTFWKVFGCIADINFVNNRYATMHDIHRKTGINMDSIRKHVARGKKSVIKEYRGYNNARYFCTWEAEKEIKKNSSVLVNFTVNTNRHINSLKFRKEKKQAIKLPTTSHREYGSITERQEKMEINKKKIQKS